MIFVLPECGDWINDDTLQKALYHELIRYWVCEAFSGRSVGVIGMVDGNTQSRQIRGYE